MLWNGRDEKITRSPKKKFGVQMWWNGRRFENHLTFGQSECVVTINAYYALKPCTKKKITECCVQSTTLNVISDLQTTGFFNICVRKWECVFVDLQFAFRRYNIFHLNNHFVVWNAEKYGYVLTLRLLYFF